MSKQDEKIETIQKLITSTEKQAWELFRKLGGGYDNCWEQFEDMERLGQFGKTLRKLSEARSALAYATNHYSDGVKSL